MILITGASGYIGSALFERLKEKKVLGIRSKSKKERDNDLFRPWDLSDEKEVKELFKEVFPEAIFHFAALASPEVNQKNPILATQSHIQITSNILNNMPEDAHIIFLSTDKVFDGSNPNPNEESPTNPLSLYGELKLRCEEMIKEKTDKFHILRLPIVHSMGDSCSVAFIDKALIELRAGRAVESFSNVSRCYVRLEQLVELLVKTTSDTNYGIYHVGTAMMSYYDRIKQLCEEEKINWSSKLLPKAGDVIPLSQNLNTDKFEKIFGFSLN